MPAPVALSAEGIHCTGARIFSGPPRLRLHGEGGDDVGRDLRGGGEFAGHALAGVHSLDYRTNALI